MVVCRTGAGGATASLRSAVASEGDADAGRAEVLEQPAVPGSERVPGRVRGS